MGTVARGDDPIPSGAAADKTAPDSVPAAETSSPEGVVTVQDGGTQVGERGLSFWEERPVAHWARRWGVPLVEAHPRLDSSNDRARALGRAGAPSFSVVIAEEQSRGRGRRGRRWFSPPGAGLWMTLLLRARAREHPALPLLAGIAAARAVEDTCPNLSAEIKWPNDLIVAGRKVGGILCESWEGARAGSGIVVGIGVNVLQRQVDFPPELRARASSLVAQGCRSDIRRPVLAGALVARLRRLLHPAPASLRGGLHRELVRRDALVGHAAVSSTGVFGTARGITPEGALLIEEPGGQVRAMRSGGVRRAPVHS